MQLSANKLKLQSIIFSNILMQCRNFDWQLIRMQLFLEIYCLSNESDIILRSGYRCSVQMAVYLGPISTEYSSIMWHLHGAYEFIMKPLI